MGIKQTMTFPPAFPQVLPDQDQTVPHHRQKRRTFGGFRTVRIVKSNGGYSFVEVVVVMAIIATLTGIGLPAYTRTVNTAKVARAEAEIRDLEKAVMAYSADYAKLPDGLVDIGRDNARDPWGNLYVYYKVPYRIDTLGQPINLDFDLYSEGPDGGHVQRIDLGASVDDIIRGGDGSYVGPARLY